MTTVAAASAPLPPVSPVMSGVSWQTYDRLRRELDEASSNVRITYDRGRMVLMSPTPRHDKWTELIGQLIEALADERGMLISAYGSTTWKREDLARGLEADKCYYVQHAEAMRGKLDIDLSVDPPPDLAVEIEVTHLPINKPAIYASLGVPELWQYDGERVECLQLQSDGRYAPARTSRAFSGFHPADLHQFVSMFPQSLDGEIVRAFRESLRRG
jgi:Uma2 family endonuclease